MTIDDEKGPGNSIPQDIRVSEAWEWGQHVRANVTVVVVVVVQGGGKGTGTEKEVRAIGCHSPIKHSEQSACRKMRS